MNSSPQQAFEPNQPDRSDAATRSIPTTQLSLLFALPSDSIEIASLRQLGRFHVERLLGRGGAGLVYLAFDPVLQRRVAIKLLRGKTAAGDRLEREARLLALLDHALIATVHSLEETIDGVPMLITEYVRGETLAARLSRGFLGIEQSLRICCAIASAIELAHQRGVLHCDVKPSNIMLTEGNSVKVLDFGLARMMTAENGRVGGGTPGYSSPEQAAGLSVGPPTDVFGLGCVLFECLAGRPAFDSSAGLGATAIGEVQWDWLPQETPERVKDVLRRCLAREPGDRRVSAGELRMVLQQASRPSPESEAAAIPNNLPVQFTRFIGRTTDLITLGELVASERLVTLVGTGGCGKSRLAIAVARTSLEQFAGGAWCVELASCTDEGDVFAAIAQSLGVREQPGHSLMSLLGARIQSQRLLLLLDNCEHLVRACANITARLLQTCPQLHVLATSREALSVGGEQLYDVPSLSLPCRNRKAGEESDSVRLFVDRALLVRPEFPLEPNRAYVEAICETLDGIPLAIEMAAARLRHTTARHLAAAVLDRYNTLKDGNRGALPRHQTLRDLIDWSYSLLTPREQEVLRRLSVFSNGWTLRAAERIRQSVPPGSEPGLSAAPLASADVPDAAVADVLVELANKSLLIFEELDGEPRFRMLETLRQYAAERLAETDAPDSVLALRRAHAAYFLELSGLANQRLTGADQQRALRDLRVEHDNLRAALRWLEGEGGDPSSHLHLAVNLTQFWYMCGFVNEGRIWLTGAVNRACDAPRGLLAQAANCLGILAWVHGDQNEAMRCYERSAALWEELGNLSRLAAVTSNLAAAAADLGDVARARASHARSIGAYERLGDTVGVARAKSNLSVLLNQEEQYTEAEQHIDACLPVFELEKDDHRIAAAIHNRGHAKYGQGQYPEAAECFARSLSMRETLNDRIGIALDQLWLGLCSVRRGQTREGLERLIQAESLRKETGATLSRVDQKALDTVLRELQQTIGPDAFRAAWGGHAP